MSDVFELTGAQLTLDQILKSIRKPLTCSVSVFSLSRLEASFELVKEVIASGKTVYGINTGFGSLANKHISANKLRELQRNIVLSHACGTGKLLDDDTVALILLLKIHSLAQGMSGVSVQLVAALTALYNQRVYPCIPCKGSVGASGDLVPLAHLTMSLLGEGQMRYQGKTISAIEGLRLAGLSPLDLHPKEGLAMLNGLQVSTAIALQAYFECQRLYDAALIAGSLSVDAASGSDVPFDARLNLARRQSGQIEAAQAYRELLADSPIREAHRDCAKVQDPYSLRCQPQIMGAVLHQMRFVGTTLQDEANAVTDNPLVFADTKQILSGGNFHGEFIAMAADNLALAIAEMGANSERRIALLIDHHFSGLPAFLVKDSGLNSGFMIPHVTAAACASDNKALAHPHSVDSIPTSANQEDHVSMATNGARRLHHMLDNTKTIIAIELLAACQGLEFHLPLTTSPALLPYYQKIRAKIKPYDKDRYFASDIETVKKMIDQDEFSREHENEWQN